MEFNSIKMKYKIVGIMSFMLLYLILYKLGITCIIKYFFKIDCLGCGYTRALIYAIKFDFKKAFYFHKMFWSFPVLLLYFFLDGKVFKNKAVNLLIPFFIFIGFLINWISRI